MSCNLIRLRCELRSEGADGKAPEHPQPDHRLFDLPPGMANTIARWYRQQGWDVIEEVI